jgi:hypothetical protein
MYYYQFGSPQCSITQLSPSRLILRAHCFATPKSSHHGESVGIQVAQFLAVLKEIQDIDTKLRLTLEGYLDFPGYGDESSEHQKRNQG